MVAKLAAGLITLVINFALGIVVFFFLLIAMNGYSESDAQYGIAAYMIFALIVTFVMSGLSVLAVHILMKREVRGAIAASIAVIVFSIIGAGLKLVCVAIGAGVAEYVRVHY